MDLCMVLEELVHSAASGLAYFLHSGHLNGQLPIFLTLGLSLVGFVVKELLFRGFLKHQLHSLFLSRRVPGLQEIAATIRVKVGTLAVEWMEGHEVAIAVLILGIKNRSFLGRQQEVKHDFCL